MPDQTAQAGKDAPAPAASPYSTGGGGVTFAHRVAATYLAGMLLGDRRSETDELPIDLVAFQTGPLHPVDDLLLIADDGKFELAVACRATPHFVQSDEATVKLVGSLLNELGAHPGGYVAVAVAGTKLEWDQVAVVCAVAKSCASPASFVAAMETDGRWSRPVRDRYKHLAKMVELALGAGAARVDVSEVSWNLLSRLQIIQFAVQVPHETEWASVASSLDGLALTPADGAMLRDQIFVNAAQYDAIGATVDSSMLRRDVHSLIDRGKGDHSFRAIFDQYRSLADGAVRRTMGVGANSITPLELPLTAQRADLAGQIRTAATNHEALIVTGPSGTGKSALVLSVIADLETAEPKSFESIVVNFRELPRTTLELEHIVGAPLRVAFDSISAPARVLVIDAADAASERSAGLLRDLVLAATTAKLGIVVVSAEPAFAFVRDVMLSILPAQPVAWRVTPLDDDELKEVAVRFPLLTRLLRNVPKGSLLRHLVVLDLISRTGLELSGQVGEWDYLEMIWANVMRVDSGPSRGSPQAREDVLLSLARSALAGPDVAATTILDSAAVDALRADHLLAPASLYTRAPEFAHDEIRRYATAIYLVKSQRLAAELVEAHVPRWSLSSVTLACKGLLVDPSARSEEVFRELVLAFDSIAESHGRRWADVPVEAVLETPASYECIKAEVDDASSPLELADVLRVLEQRFSTGGFVDQTVGTAVARYLVEQAEPWEISKKAFEYLASWLQAVVASHEPAGNEIRAVLRKRLMEFWAKYPFDPPKSTNAAKPSRRRYRTPDLDYHLTGEEFVESLALLGPDIDAEIESILRTLALHAPAFLSPAVDAPFSARGISQKDPELLADLIEAYYIDDDKDDGWGYGHDEGIRSHQGRWTGIGPPFDAYWFGGFWQLFMNAQFTTSARVLNRILNHGARKRVEISAGYGRNLHSIGASDDEAEPQAMTLRIDGQPREYWGDGSVWNWYRGTSVGPYPCLSAIQAMERWAERLLEAGISGALISKMLLDGCENVAVPAMLFGLFTRHLETHGAQLDPYLADPSVWMFEFSRVASESVGFRASSDGLVHPERRQWTPREVSVALMTRGNEERRAELRSVGKLLIANGEQDAIDENRLLNWAASLDDSSYKLSQEGESIILEVVLPQQVLESQVAHEAEQKRVNTALGLQNRYWARRSDAEPLSTPEIAADLATARSLLEGALRDQYPNPVHAVGQVVRAAVERAASGDLTALATDGEFAIRFAVEVAGMFTSANQRDEGQYFDLGADRAVARSLPALITPAFEHLRHQAGVSSNDIGAAGSAMATNASFETRLFLARGCDPVWAAPCAGDRCHHRIAFEWLMDTTRGAELGNWDNESQRQVQVTIEGDVRSRLGALDAKSVYFADLAPAIRGLGSAAVANVCVSEDAQKALEEFIVIQRKSIARHEGKGRSVDDRGTYALITVRALLQGYSVSGNPDAIFDHLDAICGSSGSLTGALHGFAAAGAESDVLATAAAKLWPSLLSHALGFEAVKPSVFRQRTWGSWAAAALLPNPEAWTQGLYHELSGPVIDWVGAEELVAELDDWVLVGQGESKCVDALIRLLRKLPAGLQATQGVAWVASLCIQDGKVSVVNSWFLNDWLKEVRLSAEDHETLIAWQNLVDALVVAGNSELAAFSA